MGDFWDLQDFFGFESGWPGWFLAILAILFFIPPIPIQNE
jgi:hypothetical protein